MGNQLIKDIKRNQPQIVNQFETVIRKKKVTHAYIIEGEDSVLSYNFSLWMTQNLFCNQLQEGLACGSCEKCRRIEMGEFPDCLVVKPDGQTIKVDQVREIKKAFVRSGIESRKKILIIKEAEKMTTSAANGLLRFIEEPDGQMHIFFLTNNLSHLLPTIQSRCQIVRLKPVSKKQLMNELKKDNQLSNQSIELLAELSDSLEQAVELLNDEWFNSAREAVEKWFLYLNNSNPLSFIFVQQYLTKLAKDKEQQFMVLDILLVLYRIKLKKDLHIDSNKQKTTTHFIELIIKTRKKLAANVSFQNTCEQLAWQILTRHDYY